MTSPKSFSAVAVAHRTATPGDGPAPLTRAQHDRMANAIRALAMDAVEQAKSGHPGLPMGAADIATVLFTRFLSSTLPIPLGQTATASCFRPATAQC